MKLESRRIAIVPRARAHQLGVLSVALVIALFLFAPFAQHLGAPFGLAVLLAPLLSYLAMRAARGDAADAGSLEILDGTIEVRHGPVREGFSFDDIDGAVIREAVASHLEIGLRNGDVISVELSDVTEGNAIIRRLTSLGLMRRQALRMTKPYLSWAPLSTSAGLILFGLVLATNLATRFVGPSPLFRVVLFAGVVVWTWVIVHRRASPGVTIARDGLTIARAFSARFIPWAAILRTELVHGLVVLRLRDGHLIELTADERSPMTLAVLIDRGLARSRGSNVDAATAALERDGRSIEAWRTSLLELTDDRGDTAYRAAQLSRATLEDVLDDPAAPAERRIGAALGLRAIDPQCATRVRLAAESCANEHLRLALEKVAEDELDVGAVEDAARAEQA